MRLASSLAALAVLATCSSNPLAPGFEDDLTRKGGCGDVVFYAADAADERLLTFTSQGPLAEALAAGEPTTSTWHLPDGDVAVRLEQGARLSQVVCNDVLSGGGPQVARTWTAVGGVARLTLRPSSDGSGLGRGDLVLEAVVLEDAEGVRITVQSLTWSDVSVGWYAG